MNNKSVFCFARMNPPTKGHEKLLMKLSAIAREQNAQPYVFLSHKQDTSTNPLSWEVKKYFFNHLFPGIPVASDENITTLTHVLEFFQSHNITDVTMAVGDDRVNDFKWIYNYLDDFNINSFNIASAGERDADADGVEGASASKAREAVKNTDFDAFLEMMPSTAKPSISKMLYAELQKVLDL